MGGEENPLRDARGDKTQRIRGATTRQDLDGTKQNLWEAARPSCPPLLTGGGKGGGDVGKGKDAQRKTARRKKGLSGRLHVPVANVLDCRRKTPARPDTRLLTR